MRRPSILSCLLFAEAASAKNCWKTLAPIGGGARQEHGAAAVGTDVYILGGIANGQWAVPTVEKYDTITNKWSTAPPMPTGLHHPNVATVNGKLYVLGGMGYTPDGIWPPVPATFSFDPATQKWEDLGTMPNPRGASSVGVHGSKVYLAGGLSARGKGTTLVSVFDTVGNKWKDLPEQALPEGREHVGGAVIGDTFYAVGGRLDGILKNTTWTLDLAKPQSWINIATMRAGRGGLAVSLAGGKIYAFGGEGNPNPGTRGVWPDSESFDRGSKAWSEEVPMKTPRHGTQASTVGEWIYLAGGGAQQGGGALIDSVEAYGPGPC